MNHYRKKKVIAKHCTGFVKDTFYKVRQCDICFDLLTYAIVKILEPPHHQIPESDYLVNPLTFSICLIF